MLFAIILIKENKSRKLSSQKVRKKIASIARDEFLKCFNCTKDDAVWWSFKMNDLVNKGKEKKQIWRKKYAMFITIISRLATERMIYLRLVNSKKDNEDKKKENPF